MNRMRSMVENGLAIAIGVCLVALVTGVVVYYLGVLAAVIGSALGGIVGMVWLGVMSVLRHWRDYF